MDERKIVELARILEDIPRSAIAQIAVPTRAIGRGMTWGLLIGGIAAVPLTKSSCRTQSCDSQGALIFPMITAMGLGLGSALGAAFPIEDVIYRAP